MKSLLFKLFYTGDWNIAFRARQPFFDYNNSFKKLPSIKNYWFADSIIYQNNDKTYLFCEAFNKKEQKGELGVFEYSEEKGFNNFKIIISEGYHLSYPCVFKANNKHYMIPESMENGTLDLYESYDFPFGWKKKKTLLSNVLFADPTVIKKDNSFYIVCYSQEEGKTFLYLYSYDENTEEVKFVKKEEGKNIIRPAGYFFFEDNHLLRPAQDCLSFYGKTITFFDSTNDLLSTKKFSKLDETAVLVDNKNVSRVHTYTRTNNLEVIDYTVFKFHLFKRIECLKRKVKLNKRKRKK